MCGILLEELVPRFWLEQFGGDMMSLSLSSEFEQGSRTVFCECVSKLTIKRVSCVLP